MRKSLVLAVFLTFWSVAVNAEEYQNPSIFWNKKTKDKIISITVDDCNNPRTVEKMLEIAESKGVKLTFFPTGINVLNNKKLWIRIHQLGHGIELHTYSHMNLNAKEERQLSEITKNISAVRSVIGDEIVFSFLRPPFGSGIEKSNKPKLFNALREASVLNGKAIDIAMWNVDLLFIRGKLSGPEQIRDQFMSKVSPGNIFLFHARKEDAVYFDKMLSFAQDKGYEMVTLSRLMEKKTNYEKEFELTKNVLANSDMDLKTFEKHFFMK